MRSPARRLRTACFPLCALSLPLLLGASAAAASTPPAPRTDETARLFAPAATALRARNCAGAIGALDALAAKNDSEGRVARVAAGLYAHSCLDTTQAERRLFAIKDPGGPLEDWRLLVLAESATARGHLLVAQTALARLLGDYPASPLRPRALHEAAELHRRRGDAARALELVEHGRKEGLGGEWGARLEELGWQIGGSLGDRAVQEAAARRLLARHPSEAARLEVAEIFRLPNGTLDWRQILGPAELGERARALLALDLAASAATTLDAVPDSARGFDWHLQKAEVLTRSRRGAEALTLLAGRSGKTPAESARLEWTRARAAADVAAAYRGRTNLASEERQRMRLRARQHLQKVADVGADPELSAKALRLLYADLAEDEQFERSLEVLRALRRVDPADTTGTDNLWQLGWREYLRRNYTGAIGYWTEMADLYPKREATRRGRYWAARSFELLGEAERAQQIYRELATEADTTDLYRKNALARLRTKMPATPALSLTERGTQPWPMDPVLARATLLSDLGLDEHARSEMELVRAKARQGSLDALDALILARQGQRRTSIQVIRRAFPSLGGPYQATLPAEALKLYYPLDYQDTINTWARSNQLPTWVVQGIIRQESAFDTRAQSWAGARGLMQLMPATARELAGKMGLVYSHEELSNPAFNVRLGTTYFRQVLSMFDDNLELALAGYNGGPYRIKRMWRESGQTDLDQFLETLTIEESKTYVKRILVLSDSYRQLYPQAG